MGRLVLLCAVAPLLLLGACSSAEDRNARAQEDVANKRLELIEKHEDCVKAAKGDQVKIDACKHYLDEADALK
jgi:hypothetical protein